jgi:hypothetical protein
MAPLFLLMFAFVFFCIATFFYPATPQPQPAWYGRFNFVSAGLAACTLAEIIVRWPSHL